MSKYESENTGDLGEWNSAKMAAARRKQDDKNLEVLRELITCNGNKYCFDCNQRGPTYVNTTIGSFVCSKCSGMLRGLTPPHRVKSISMATFTPAEMEFVKSRGNDYCRRIWLSLFEGESKTLKDEQSIKDFMSDKYEKKRYYLEASSSNQKVASTKSEKPKSSTRNGANATTPLPLITINSQSSTRNSAANTANNFLQISANASQTPKPPPVSEFPVDFSTANIYNSNQGNNNSSKPQSSAFANIKKTNAVTNDRYAALADLDFALRQQNSIKTLDNNAAFEVNKNPFHIPANTDKDFMNKNPFYNGVWKSDSIPNHVNPFAGNSVGASKNPFL